MEKTFPDRMMWTLPSVLEYQAEHIPDKPCFQWTHEGKTLSFVEVNKIANRFSHGLAAQGVAKSDNVAIVMQNRPEFLWSWFGLSKLGAVEVPINPGYKGHFLEHQMNNCGAKIALVDRECLEVFKASEQNLKFLETIFYITTPESKDLPLPAFDHVKLLPHESLKSDDDADPRVEIKPWDLSCIIYTSGTEGPSKGVMMPHGQHFLFSEQIIHLMRMRENDVFIGFNPLFHLACQGINVYANIIRGSKIVLYPRFSSSNFMNWARASKANLLLLLGGTMSMLYKESPKPDDIENDLRCVLAIPTVFNILDDFKKRYGIEEVVELYGQSEVNMVIQSPYGVLRPIGAAGVRVDQYYEVALVDPETDEPVPIGTPGEFCVRTCEPWTQNCGYWGMPEKSLEVRRNLWYHTGDLLKIDENGWYYFVDRVKDALRSRGYNISSFEVESSIQLHPSVLEAAIVGLPTDRGAGENDLKAVVVLKKGEELPFEEFIAFCDANMPFYCVPRYVEYIDALPKTPTDKIQKHKLRDTGVNEKTWDRLEAGCLVEHERKRAERKK
jgi:crotonobetaine/carnitine-CoA ligase